MDDDHSEAIKRIGERTTDEIRRILDAKVEALWQLGEPNDRPLIATIGNITAVSDVECRVAEEAVYAIVEKYGIKKHDFAMWHRAERLIIYHRMCRKLPARLEFSDKFPDHILWQ